MSLPRRFAATVTARSRAVVVLMLLVTAALGAGVPMIDADADLDAITGDSPEVRANEYVEDNFTAAGGENTTSVLLVTTGENVLTRDSLIESLRLQQRLRANDSVNRTLIEDDPITGIENVIAIAVIGEQLEDRGDRLEERSEELNETTERLEAGLDEIRALQRAFERDTTELNESDPAYQERKARLESAVAAVTGRVTKPLTDGQRWSYNQSTTIVRNYESRLFELEQNYGENASERTSYNQTELALEGEYTWATLAIREGEFAELLREADEIEDRADALEESRPPLDEQIAALRDSNLTREEYEHVLRDTLEGDGPRGNDVLRLVTSSYRINTTDAGARMTILTQRTSGPQGFEGITNETLIDAQFHVREIATEFRAGGGEATVAGDDAATAGNGRYLVFGGGLVEAESDRAMIDTLELAAPLALLLVVLALAVAYRDPLDIALGLAGLFAVLVWTFGMLGWVGIPFNVLIVAVPVLLIGIAVDFAVHLFMRHREHRADGSGAPGQIRDSMTLAIAGVGIALFWAAATTVIGFLANAVSPLGIIRQFGVASAFGIAAALLVFTTLVPAAKIELDERLESVGFDRHRPAFGTTGRLSRVLSVGATAARRAPVAVLALVLVVTVVSAAGAVGVDTTFQQEDFIAHSPPDWTYALPGPMAPGEYRTADDLEVVNEQFRPADAEAQILLRGDVATVDAFERLLAAREDAAANDVVYTLPNGRADIQDPLSVMRSVADGNESFNESFIEADVDDDRVPERNVSGLYEDLFAADSDAASEVIHRTPDGEYAAIRLVVGVRGDASYAATADAMRTVAASIEAAGSGGSVETPGPNTTTGTSGSNDPANATATTAPANLTAVATGQSVVNRVIEQALFETLTRSFLVTLVAVFVTLTVGYRLAGHGATLGAVTLLPVTLSVAWILGTMALLDVPFNVLTVTITSLTIGLGVSYSIHVSARYRLELDRQGDAWDALATTVTGTGGALLGSAATTTAAFGTLSLAILPVLGQFGAITATTIVYAFVASVFVLPTLLVLWTKRWGPDGAIG
jgi:predicted RND superfamily exporter protein